MADKDALKLVDLGDWTGHKIGDHAVIRHAYEGALTACARLQSYASGKARVLIGTVSERQDLLAVDDLVAFAIHSRRLIENTLTPGRIASVEIPVTRGIDTQPGRVTRVVNIIIHHKYIRVARSDWVLKKTDEELYAAIVKPSLIKPIRPVVLVESDQGAAMAFPIDALTTAFELKILGPVIELCDDHKLYLEPD